MDLEQIKSRKIELRSELESNINCDLDKIETELRSLEETEEKLVRRKEICERLSNSTITGNIVEKPIGNVETREYGIDSKEYRSAFFKNLAGVELNEIEKRAMTTGMSSAGVSVPTVTLNKIYEKIQNGSITYGLVTVSHLRGNVSIPIEKSTSDVERKGEGEDGSIQEDTIEDLKLGAKKYIKLVKLTCELENTAIDALEDYIVRKLSKKLMLAFDSDIINGDGVNGAKGILKTITGKTTSGASWTLKDILKLFSSIPAIARKSATLMMSTNTLYNDILAISDANDRPIFDVTQNKVLGRVVEECDDVPDGTIIFGDFSEYMFNWSKDAELSKSKEAAFASGDSVYRILALADGGLADLGAMAVMSLK